MEGHRENSQYFLNFYSHDLKEQREGFIPLAERHGNKTLSGVKIFNLGAAYTYRDITWKAAFAQRIRKSGKRFGQESLWW